MIIGIGCDVVERSRITLSIGDKILSVKEKELCKYFNEKRKLEFIAGRFAAKEAIIKAINKKGVLLSDIEVLYENDKPVCNYENYKILVSISHDINTAIAFAICEGKNEVN